MAAARMWLVADLDHRDPVVAGCWELVRRAAEVEEVLAALALAQPQTALNLAILRLDDSGAEIVVRGEAWAAIAEQPADQERSLRAAPGQFTTAKVDGFAAVSLGLPVENGAQQSLWPLVEGVVPVAEFVVESDHPVAPAYQEPQPLAESEPAVGRFDALFGKTVHQSETERQTAAVPEEWMAGMRQPAAAPADPVVDYAQPAQDAWERPHTAGAPLFADVSWAHVPDSPGTGPQPYEPAPSAVVSSGSGGIDPELLLTVQRAPAAPAATGPVVETVRCAAQHLNPPDAGRCRICGGTIPAQTPRAQARPRLGVLRLSTGEVVPLDRGVIVGRAPGAPDGFGRDEPYRIQVPSPDSSISRKHVEVVLEGWTVTVIDLKSTNGTQIVPAEGTPQLLAPGDRRVIEPGWTVRLDERTSFRFEVTE
jgi:hypothetical protein